MSRGRQARLALLAALVSLLLLLAGAEIALRLAGRGPWIRSTLDLQEPVMHEPDPVLGWRNKPGRYVIPPYAPGSASVVVTQLEDGRRAAAADEGEAARDLVLVGGSYTKGTAVSDDETYGWRLQLRFPELRVRNFGTGGFGTLQSWLALERALPDTPPGSVALYGFIDHHELRNVAPASWQDLLSRFSRRRQVDVPYATLDASGELVRHAPERHPAWPLHEWLASVAFAEQVYARARAAGREAQARPVTEAILEAMDALATSRGVTFAVALLAARPEVRSHYRAFLRERGIPVADCVRPLTPELLVPREGHPNGRVHALWARCIASELGPLLAGDQRNRENR